GGGSPTRWSGVPPGTGSSFVKQRGSTGATPLFSLWGAFGSQPLNPFAALSSRSQSRPLVVPIPCPRRRRKQEDVERPSFQCLIRDFVAGRFSRSTRDHFPE